VSGARQLFYEQGVEKTSLADIADGSGVPIGNVYYYFKTKDELVEAVIDSHAEDISRHEHSSRAIAHDSGGSSAGALDRLAGLKP
jgi:TetR/AcrR family transcriptional regulator, transcriptional repressor for nem operon